MSTGSSGKDGAIQVVTKESYLSLHIKKPLILLNDEIPYHIPYSKFCTQFLYTG